MADTPTSTPPQVGPPEERHFVGRYEHVLDQQHRISIPKDWREADGRETTLYLVLNGREDALQVMTKAVFEGKYYEPLHRQANLADDDESDALAYLFSHSAKVICDRQGRVTIPEELIRQIHLGDSAVLRGAADHFVICSPEVWAQVESRRPENRQTAKSMLHAARRQSSPGGAPAA